MYGVLPFFRNYFWPCAVRGRRINGVTQSATIRLITNDRKRGRPGMLNSFLIDWKLKL